MSMKTQFILNFASILLAFFGCIKYAIMDYPELVLFSSALGFVCLGLLLRNVGKLYKEAEYGKKINS